MESQLVFGSQSSPAIYDHLHEIFLRVARLRSNSDGQGLDDFVPVTPDKVSNEWIVNSYVNQAN